MGRFKATDGKKGRIVVGSRSTDRRRSQSKKGRKYSPSRSSSKKINNKSKRKHSKSGSVARERSKSLRKSKDPPIVRNQNLIHYHDKKGSKESKKGRWVPEDGSQTRPAKRRRHSSPSRSKKSRSSSYNRKDTEKINSIRITVEDKNREVRRKVEQFVNIYNHLNISCLLNLNISCSLNFEEIETAM